MFTLSLSARRLAAVLVSAMMAFPAPSWGSNSDSSGGDTTDGIPVILLPVQTPDGRAAYLAIAPIPVEQEAQFITAAAKHDPEHTVLAVNGPQDSALKAALASGYLPKLHVFNASSVESSPLANSPELSKSIRGKFSSVINKMTDFLRDKQKQFALAETLYVGGFFGSFTFIESSSVSAGLGVFGAVMAWAGFQTAFTHQWEHLMEKGGDAIVGVFSWAAGLIGQELSPTTKRLFAASGSFYVAWVANTAMVSWIFANAGVFESLLAAALYGYAAAYDIYDKNIANRVNRGLLAPKWLTRFVGMRVFLGTIFEVMSFSHVPYMQLALTTLTTAGLLWLALGSDFEDKVINGAHSTTIRVLESARGVASQIKTGCEALLKRKPKGEGP